MSTTTKAMICIGTHGGTRKTFLIPKGTEVGSPIRMGDVFSFTAICGAYGDSVECLSATAPEVA